MKILRAVTRVYGYHLSVVLFSIFMLVPLFSLAQRLPYLFTTISFLLYVLVLYPVGWNYGYKDSRKIPGFYPDKRFAVQAAGLMMVIPGILFMLRAFFPDIWYINLPIINGEKDLFLTGVKSLGTTDMIFKIWFFPMCAFVTNGKIFVYFLWVLFQPAIFVLGYFLGLKRISIKNFIFGMLVYKNGASGKK